MQSGATTASSKAHRALCYLVVCGLTISFDFTGSSGAALAQGTSGPVYQEMMTEAYKRGDMTTAEQIGHRLLLTEPTNLATHYLLGNIYLRQGQRDRAQAEYNYCLQRGKGSQIETLAAQAMKVLTAAPITQPNAISPALARLTTTNTISPNSVGTNHSAPAGPGNIWPTTPSQAAPENKTPLSGKVDIEILEYKERLLKMGADLIAANRTKLNRQIATMESRARDNPEEQDTTAKIDRLKEQNAADELRITAFYKNQVDSIGNQRDDLTSQTQPGNGDVRLVQHGTGMFVRNYINYHGDLPLPPLPPELHAIAQKLSDTPAKKTAKTGVGQK